MLKGFAESRTLGRVRHAAVLLGAAVVGLVAVACSDQPTAAVAKHFGPGHASLSVAPTFAALPAGSPSIVLSKIVGVLVGPSGDSIFATSTFDGDSAILVFDVQITGSSADFKLNLTAFDKQGVVAFTSSQSVTIKPGNNPGVAAPQLVYAAPDAGIQALHVTPPSAVLNAGGSASFSVTGTGANGQSIPPLRINWTTSDPSVATVDDDGALRAGQFEGSTWVVARAANGVADSAVVSVHAAVDHIVLSPPSLQLIRGTSSPVAAQLLDAGNHVINDRQAVLSSSDPSVATVSATGAVQGLKVGTTTITATAEGKSATASVSVVSPIDHIELTPPSLTFAAVGGKSQAVVTRVVARAGASVDGLVPTLASSNPFVATVDAAGNVTALSDGSTTITASVDGVSASMTVTVKQVVAAVTVTPASATATSLGDAVIFKATAYDAAGNAIPTAIVTWTSGDPRIGAVDSDGRVIAGQVGTATITATSGTVAGSASFTVSQTPRTIKLTSDKSSFMVTQSATLAVRVADANDNVISGVQPQWSTTTPTIASVSVAGVVTGLAVGTAHVAVAASGLTSAIDLQVTSLPAVTLTLNTATGNVLALGTAQFTVVSGGAGPFAWTVNGITGGNASVGTVSVAGLYTAPSAIPSPASVSVCATQVSPPGQACAQVNVTGPPVLDVATADVEIGATHQFSVASGGTAPFTWLVNNAVSGNATVGTVTSAGLYTAPSSVPSPATFDVCATQAAPAAVVCAHVTVKPLSTTTLVLNASTSALRKGASTTFGVVSGGNGSGQYTWTVSGGTPTGTVTSAGYYTAPDTVPSAPVNVCASQTYPVGKACVVVTVSAPPTLSPASVSVLTLATQQFTAVGGTGPFTWSVSPAGAASGTVSASGLYTAPLNVPTSTVSVCVSQTTPLAITCAPVTIKSLTIAPPGTTKVVVNRQQAFTVTGGTNPYTWTVGDASNGVIAVGTSAATYNAPASVPTQPTVQLCVSEASQVGQVCAYVKIMPGVTGRVVDASTGNGISGAKVRSTTDSTTTSSDGSFAITDVTNGTDLTIDATGFISTQYVNVQAGSTSTPLGNLPLAPTSGSRGIITGTLTDAVNGHGIPSATLTFYPGINASSGFPSHVTSDQNGVFTDTLDAGTYTLVASGLTGYSSSSLTVWSIGGQTPNSQNFILSPGGLTSASYRIVLQWNEYPRDLDGHLVGPTGNGTNFEIYYHTKTYAVGTDTIAKQDMDDTTGYGPETITLNHTIAGKYRYYVDNYSHDSSYAVSGAHVTVYRGDSLAAQFSVPAGGARVWTVFELNGATGGITSINTLSTGPIPVGGSASFNIIPLRGTQTDVQALLERVRANPKPIKPGP